MKSERKKQERREARIRMACATALIFAAVYRYSLAGR